MRNEDQRSVTIGAKSYDALWAEFAANKAEQQPPEYALSARQYSEKYDVPLNRARKILETAEATGRMRGELFCVRTPQGVRSVRFYWPKTAAVKSAKSKPR